VNCPRSVKPCLTISVTHLSFYINAIKFKRCRFKIGTFKRLYMKVTDIFWSKVFALSKQNAQWFLKQGFVKMDIRELPKKRQALFDHQRNSSVFFKIVAKENL
jgi:amino-acid N-acetyltransferase